MRRDIAGFVGAVGADPDNEFRCTAGLLLEVPFDTIPVVSPVGNNISFAQNNFDSLFPAGTSTEIKNAMIFPEFSHTNLLFAPGRVDTGQIQIQDWLWGLPAARVILYWVFWFSAS